MKEDILFVLKEVGVCLGLIAISVGLNIFLFKDYATNDVIVENAKVETYSAVEREKYVVINADIQDEQNPTQKYETVDGELDAYATELRFTQGTINPFVSESSGYDIPSDMINSSSSGDAGQ